MARKKDLQETVNRLNEKFCKHGKNQLVINQAYGGFQVGLTGKLNKNGKYKKDSLESGQELITYGFDTATNVINKLNESEARGWLESKIKRCNSKKGGVYAKL